MKLDIALEWFLNPDHLPFVMGLDRGWFDEAGFEVSLREPEDHYDGLAAVVSGEVAFACNEPLHMIDAHRPDLKALGCFFETEGGILLRPEGRQKLLAGTGIRVASPVAGEVTDSLSVEILSRWSRDQGVDFRPEQVVIESAGFEHLKNLRAGYDAAWLCFANFEGVEARHLGVNATFITTDSVGLRNFSALELFTGGTLLREQPETVRAFVDVVSRGAAACRDAPDDAARTWYRHTGETPDPLMDAIIADTCNRMVAPVRRDPEHWRGMWRQFRELGLSRVDAEAYNAMYE